LDFMKNMWSSMGFALPGMATPTLDVGELDKRIADLKAVEGWLKLNLNTLQMSIQGLEMQRATLAAVRAMTQSQARPAPSAASPATPPPAEPAAGSPNFAPPNLWPWALMQPPGAASAPAAAPAANPPTPPEPNRPARKGK
jgi:hypothetical protein